MRETARQTREPAAGGGAVALGDGGDLPPAIRVSALKKSYKDFLLDDVSFTLPQGFVMGLVGPNGAGKTTIIKLIMNLIRPEGGKIDLFGLDHRDHEEEVKARIGFVYDVPPLYDDVSLLTTKRAVSIFYEKWNETLFRELAHQFQLPLKKKLKALSNGMQTKFALALALSHDADLLILDEPTNRRLRDVRPRRESHPDHKQGRVVGELGRRQRRRRGFGEDRSGDAEGTSAARPRDRDSHLRCDRRTGHVWRGRGCRSGLLGRHRGSHGGGRGQCVGSSKRISS
jgi:ABC-type Na+ transport system ATPase subunit NatA